MRNLFSKIQSLPESKRKIIFWVIITILTLVLLNFYIKNFQRRLRSFKVEEFKKEIRLPSWGEIEKSLK